MLRYWYVIVVCLFAASLAIAQPRYTLVPLDGIPNALDPTSLTAIGSVLSDLPGRPQQPAFLTEAGPVLLGLLPDGTFGSGVGICGAYATGFAGAGPLGLLTHAFKAVAGEDHLRDLGDGDQFSAGAAVNCVGEVAGRIGDATLSRILPAWWDVDDVLHELETFQPTGSAGAEAINAVGRIAGNAQVGRDAHCAFWPEDTRAIQDCGVDAAGRDFSTALAISTDGHIVGPFFVVGSPEPQHGFLREPDGTIVPLLPADPSEQSIAADLNDSGLIVGWRFRDPPVASAPFASACVLWQDDASPVPPVPVDLATLVTNGAGWDLRRCVGVNEAGVILGQGTLNGVVTAFLAIPEQAPVVAAPPAPLPEPETKEKRRKKDHRGPVDLGKILAHWQERQAQAKDKVARWEAACETWKQTHRH